MSNDIKNMSARLAPLFAASRDITCAYLFGSHARGTSHRGSDVDIAVLFSDDVNPDEYTDRQLSLIRDASAVLSSEVDVVVLNRAPAYLTFQIVRGGVRVFDRRTTRDLERRVMLEYYDYLPIRRRMENALLKKIKERAYG